MRNIKILLLLLIALMPSNTSYAEDFWLVKKSAIKCVIKNLPAYDSVKTNLVLIFLDECPETDLATILKNRTKNSSSLPKVPQTNSAEESELVEVITLSKSQLGCLKTFDLSEKVNDILKLPKKVCP